MPLISTVYLIIFLPLICAALCLLFKDKFLPFAISLATMIALILLLANIFSDVNSYQKIFNDFNLSSLSIGLEFSIDKVSMLFLFLLCFLQIVILLFFRNNFESALNKNNQATFYALLLLNTFSAIGIFTTAKLFNLFIFLEIFSLSFFALTSISLQNFDLLKNNFRYFCFAAVAKLLILFSFLVIFLTLGSADFSEINSNFLILVESNESLILLVLSLLIFSLFVNFFAFVPILRNLYNQSLSTDFALFFAVFIKANVGIYIFWRLLYFVFGTDYFVASSLPGIVSAILLVLICFFVVEIIFANRVRSIAVNIALAESIFILMALFTLNKEFFRAFYSYLFLFNLSALLIFIFAGFLKSKLGNSSLSNLIKCREHHYFFLSFLICSYCLAICCFLLISFFFAKIYFSGGFVAIKLQEFCVLTAFILILIAQISVFKKLTSRPKQKEVEVDKEFTNS